MSFTQLFTLFLLTSPPHLIVTKCLACDQNTKGYSMVTCLFLEGRGKHRKKNQHPNKKKIQLKSPIAGEKEEFPIPVYDLHKHNYCVIKRFMA